MIPIQQHYISSYIPLTSVCYRIFFFEPKHGSLFFQSIRNHLLFSFEDNALGFSRRSSENDVGINTGVASANRAISG